MKGIETLMLAPTLWLLVPCDTASPMKGIETVDLKKARRQPMPTTGFLFDQSKTSPLILFAHCGVIFYEVFFWSRVSPDARGGYGAVGQRACLWPLAVIGRRSRVRILLAPTRDFCFSTLALCPLTNKKPSASIDTDG